MATLVCFGFGYCAEHFMAEFGGKFERVIGTVRRAERAGILNSYQAGAMRAVVFDGVLETPELSAAITAADYALISVPPDASGDPVLAACGGALAGRRNLRSVVYLSTVGVYGDHGGGWVDEQTPPAPRSERSRWRIAAEQAWQRFGAQHSVPVAVLRLAGIYGPDRMRSLRSRAAKRAASSSWARFSIAFTSAISRRRSRPLSRAAPPACSTSPTPIRSCSPRR